MTTDTSKEAPERIWASPEHPDENGYGGFWIAAKVAPSVQYVRDDLLTEAQAENARLRGLLGDVIDGWDWWNKDQYDRCQSVPGDAIDAARAALQEGKS